MKILQTILLTGVFLFFATSIFAQKGTVRGQVYDESRGETIPFATIQILESGDGLNSDLDGNFSVDLDPGLYTFVISYVGLATLTVNNVEVKSNQISVFDFVLIEETELVEEVIITAKQVRNTEAALLTLQRKSTSVMDGISSQTFRRTGDGDAGEAIKRVTGVSVEGGKHVFVRGLGDRYTKVIFNGMSLPGLDPDRNSVQLDVFPTNIIDNIVVFKTSTPDLPGDFTGGVVNIVSKDFPESKTFNVSLSAGFNPSMHFNDQFLGYEGGGTDWLGIDDGTRSLPFNKNTVVPEISDQNPNNRAFVTTLTSSFNPVMAASLQSNDLNKSLSISTGNQITSNKLTIGYLAAINYKNGSSFYENAEFNEFIIRDNNLVQDRLSMGNIGKSNVFWSLLAGTSFKYLNHKINLQYIRLQNGESTAAKINQTVFETNPSTIIKDNLEYVERSINNIIVTGKHSFGASKFEIDWKFMPTFTEVDEPDIRYTAFELTSDGTLEIRPSVGADVSRTFRNLKEKNFNGKIDFTYKLGDVSGKASEIRMGFLANVKERDFEILNYLLRIKSQFSFDINGNPDALFKPDNLWTPQTGIGSYIKGNREPANTFNARQNILAGYIMNELPIANKIRAIYGLRFEKADNFYTGETNNGQVAFDDQKVLDELDVLPSINLVYELTSMMNLRASGARTIARPTFKEKSLAQIQDRVSGRTFLGNIDLEETKINNFDLRWEYFLSGGQLFSVSGFYKSFSKPIELVAFDESSPDNFQPKNGGTANIIGAEIEFRKSLDFVNKNLSGLTLGSNITIVDSEIELNDGSKRQMVGQSPFIFNGIVNFINTTGKFELNLNYNYQGKRLLIAGVGSVPDVVEVPFHALNLKASQKIGKENNWSISLGIFNILDQNNKKEYRQTGFSSEIFELIKPGREIKLGLSYKIQ